MDILIKLLKVMNRKQKAQMVVLGFMMLIGAFIETLSVSMLIPLIEVIMNPGNLEEHSQMKRIFEFFHLDNMHQFTVLMILALIAVFVLKNIYLYFQRSFQLRFVCDNQFQTSRRLMRVYLDRPYEFYLHANSAEIIRTVTTDVANTYGLVMQILTLASDGVVFLGLSIMVLVLDPVMALMVGVTMALVLVTIKKAFRPILLEAGKQQQFHHGQTIKWINQSVLGVKEVIISNKEQYFVDQYSVHGKIHAEMNRKHDLLTGVPGMITESVMMTGILLYLLYITQSGQNVASMVSQLAAFAAAAIKIMPSVSRMSASMNSITYLRPFFSRVSDDLMEQLKLGKELEDGWDDEQTEPLKLHKSILLDHVAFSYGRSDRYIFKDASMEVPVGKTVGVAGPSGAGKTTAIDIMLGLLKPESGRVLADGVDISGHYAAWLKNIGYIPQMIFMLDDTIRRNVAFGVKNVDDDRVWAVLREAQLEEHVKSLPNGLDTEIGERGIRLSGGQRQRLGIARALYHDPDLLVFDEATSALDSETEAAIMESINHLKGRKTMVIIAHRLNTIENCDILYRVENGTIVRER